MSIERREILRVKFRSAGGLGRKLHVISRQGSWVVFREGSDRIISKFDTKREAIRIGRKLLKNEPENVMIIHKVDGSVEKLQKAEP